MGISNIRFKINMTTHLERELALSQNIDSLVVLFSNLIKLMGKCKHFTNVLLPSRLIPVFYSDKRLRVIYDQIHDFSLPFLFDSEVLSESCAPEESICSMFSIDYDLLEYSPEVPVRIIKSLIKREYPLLIDYENRDVLKGTCDHCDNDFLCREEYVIQPFFDFNKDFSSYLMSVEGNLANLFKSTSVIDLDQLRYAAFVQAFFFGIPESELRHINAFVVLNSFINDIQSVSSYEFKNIAFCMFRAIAFPSSQNVSERVKYSIDWHVNDPGAFGDYDLIRCDVLPPNKTGNTGSGASRLLIAKKRGQSYFIAYSDCHNFSNVLIRNRVQELDLQLAQELAKKWSSS